MLSWIAYSQNFMTEYERKSPFLVEFLSRVQFKPQQLFAAYIVRLYCIATIRLFS